MNLQWYFSARSLNTKTYIGKWFFCCDGSVIDLQGKYFHYKMLDKSCKCNEFSGMISVSQWVLHLKEPSLLNGQKHRGKVLHCNSSSGMILCEQKILEKDKTTVKQSTFRIRSWFNQDNCIWSEELESHWTLMKSNTVRQPIRHHYT